MNLSINHNSAIPLHSQVEQILRELIQQPEYRSGKLFPKEVNLYKRLGVSRNTVRHAANNKVQLLSEINGFITSLIRLFRQYAVLLLRRKDAKFIR